MPDKKRKISFPKSEDPAVLGKSAQVQQQALDFGTFLPFFLQEVQQTLGADAGREEEMRRVAIDAVSRVIADQQGGPVPKGVRVPVQQFQQGGFINNVIDSLGNVRADTGSLDATAGQLANFNPFAGGLGSTAQQALGNLLSTGNPVDVNPLTQAARSEGARNFRDLSGGINESFGALGLGSSSARSGALANAAADISQGIGETGLRAGVQAQENAAGRQLGAFNPFGQANQQSISALGTAGGLQGQSAGLNLDAQTAPLGPSVGLASSLFGGLNNQINQLPQGLSQPTQQLPTSPFAQAPGGLDGFGIAGRGNVRRGSRRGFATGGRVTKLNPDTIKRLEALNPGSSGTGGPSDRFVANQGPDRTDFGDFLGNLLFGQKFNRRVPEPDPAAADLHPPADPTAW